MSARVRLALLVVLHPGDDDADGQSHETVHLSHPRGVALGEIIVDGDDVHAVPRKRVEVGRHGGDEGLAFARAHLGYPALMQGDAAHHLHEEGTHSQHAGCRLPHRGERLGQDVVEGLAVGEPLFEPNGLRRKLVVRHGRVSFGEHIHLFRQLFQLAHLSFVLVENGRHIAPFPTPSGAPRASRAGNIISIIKPFA